MPAKWIRIMKQLVSYYTSSVTSVITAAAHYSTDSVPFMAQIEYEGQQQGQTQEFAKGGPVPPVPFLSLLPPSLSYLEAIGPLKPAINIG